MIIVKMVTITVQSYLAEKIQSITEMKEQLRAGESGQHSSRAELETRIEKYHTDILNISHQVLHCTTVQHYN